MQKIICQIKRCSLVAFLSVLSSIGLADSLEKAQAQIRHAQTCYWFGLEERGDMRLFKLGLGYVDKAEKHLHEIKNEKVRSSLNAQIKALRNDLSEQADMSHDTLYGVFPLLRYATLKEKNSELIDTPEVMAVTRATEALISTIVEHWKTSPQFDVVYNSRVSINPDSGIAVRNRSWTNNVPLQNEMAYIFNQNNKFFNHNETEIAAVLTSGELNEFYRDGISTIHADKLCNHFGIGSLMEAKITEVDVMQPYWFYQAQGKMFLKGEGFSGGDVYVFGFTRDARDAFWPIVITWCVFGLLTFFCARWVGGTFGVSFSEDQWIFPFLLGSSISVFLCHALGQVIPEPETLVKYGFWGVIIMGASISLLPASIGLLFNLQITTRFSFLERYSIGNSVYIILFFVALTAGTSIIPAYSLFVYNGGSEAVQLVALWALGSLAGILTLIIAVIRLSGVVPDSESIQSNNRYSAGLSFLTVSVFSLLCWWEIPETDHDGFAQASLGLLIFGGFAGARISLSNKNPISMGLMLASGAIVLLLSGLVFLTNSLFLMLGVAIPSLLIICCSLNAVIETLRGVRSEEAIEEDVGVQGQSKPRLGLKQILADAENKIPFLEHEVFTNCIAGIRKNLTAGKPAMFCITGAPGSGKTRSVNQLINALEPCITLKGICADSAGQQVPYKPISDAFSEYRLDLSNPDSAEWKSVLGSAAGGIMGIIPLPGIVADIIESGDEEVNAATGPEEIARSLLQLLKLMPEEGEKKPVLFIDDGEYIDDASLKVLEHLITGLKMDPFPMVIAVCARSQPDIEEKFNEIGLVSHRLDKMNREFAYVYLTEKIELEPKLADKMLQEALGLEGLVPMHLIEWINEGCANGDISDTKPFALKKGLEERDSFLGRFPRSLESAAEQSLINLDEDVLLCLEYAGILGKEFDASHLARAMNREQPLVLGQLEKAEQHGIVTDLVHKDDLFAFTSNVYVTVLKNRMLRMEDKPGQRIRAYNKIFTDLFVSEFEATNSDKSLFGAANHAQTSGQKFHFKAIALCEKAAHRAYAMHAYAEATKYAQFVLQQPLDGETDLLTLRARLWALVLRAEKITAKNTGDRESNLKEALKEWNRQLKGKSQPDDEAELLNQIALCQSDLHMFKESIKTAELSLNIKGVHLNLRLEAEHYRARAKSLLSVTEKDSNGQQKALELFDLAISQAEAIEENSNELMSVLAQLYNSRAEARQRSGDEEGLSLVMSDFEKSLELKKEINDLSGQAMTLGGMGRFFLFHQNEETFKSNAQEAVDYFKEDERISEKIGDFAGQIKMPSFIGEIYDRLGEDHKAVGAFEKSRTLARACESDIDEAFALLGLYKVHMKLNNQKELESISSDLKKLRQEAVLPGFLEEKIIATLAD